jgi:hypothetical protein
MVEREWIRLDSRPRGRPFRREDVVVAILEGGEQGLEQPDAGALAGHRHRTRTYRDSIALEGRNNVICRCEERYPNQLR